MQKVLLESAASMGLDQVDNRSYAASETRLLVFSANNVDSLRRSFQAHEEYLNINPQRLDDLAYTLSVKRDFLPLRAFCVSSGKGPLELSQFNKSGDDQAVIFVFTGQGAQWAEMGKELLQNNQVAKDTLAALDQVLAGVPNTPSWSLKGPHILSDCSTINFERRS